MSDDFGTVNVKRGDRAREIEVLRQHYKVHRDTLTQMVPDAPTEHLAAEYKRLIADIDASIRKLDELERVPSRDRARARGTAADGNVSRQSSARFLGAGDRSRHRQLRRRSGRIVRPAIPRACFSCSSSPSPSWASSDG